MLVTTARSVFSPKRKFPIAPPSHHHRNFTASRFHCFRRFVTFCGSFEFHVAGGFKKGQVGRSPKNAVLLCRFPFSVSSSPRPILSLLAADFLCFEARSGCTLRRIELAGVGGSPTHRKAKGVGMAGVGRSGEKL